jgi:hypothetical protein
VGRLLDLLRAAFASQEDRIAPPSSVCGLDAGSLAEKSSREQLFLASDGSELAGCGFALDQTPVVYVGKVAVWHEGYDRPTYIKMRKVLSAVS